MRDSAKTSSRKSTKPTRTASTATAKTTATRNFTKNNTAKDFYAVTKTLSIANPGKGRPKKQTLNRPAWRIPLHDTPIVDPSCRIRPQVVVCFAKILCALKMPRFPAAMAVPSRLSLHARGPRICPGEPERYTCIYKDGGTRTFSRRYVGSD